MQERRRGLSVCSVGFMVSSQQIRVPVLLLLQAIKRVRVHVRVYVCV